MRYILSLIACMLVTGCGEPEKQTSESKKMGSANNVEIKIGGIYATKGKSGEYRISKILALDNDIIHIRIYANKFADIPKEIDTGKLGLGGLNDKNGFGIGHAPVARQGFLIDSPVLLKVEPVKEDELEGYKMYLDAIKK